MRERLPFGGHHLYDRLVAPRIRPFYAALAQRFAGRGLDVGCGPGDLAATHRGNGHDVLGVDVDPVQTRIARRKHRLPVAVADVACLPLVDGAVDVAWTSESFHHWARPSEALREVHRVLAAGGTFWIVEGCGDITREEAEAWGLRGLWVPLARFVFRTHGYTPEALARDVLPLLAATPFQVRVHRRHGWWLVELQKAAADAGHPT